MNIDECSIGEILAGDRWGPPGSNERWKKLARRLIASGVLESAEDHRTRMDGRGEYALNLFNEFIENYVPSTLHGHLLDNDDNAGQRVRDAITDCVWG